MASSSCSRTCAAPSSRFQSPLPCSSHHQPSHEKILLPILTTFCALPLLAAEPIDDVKAAIKTLADKPNYTWVSTVKSPGAQFNAGPTTGRTEKNGFTFLTQQNNDQTTEVVLKSTNGVVKTEEGWKTAAELPVPARGGAAGTGSNRSLMAGRFLLGTKTPADFLGDLLGKVKEMKKAMATSSPARSPKKARKNCSPSAAVRAATTRPPPRRMPRPF